MSTISNELFNTYWSL